MQFFQMHTFKIIWQSVRILYFFSLAYLPDFQVTASTCLLKLKFFLAVFHGIQDNTVFTRQFADMTTEIIKPSCVTNFTWDADWWREIKRINPSLSNLIGFWWQVAALQYPANRTSCWSGWSRPPAPTAQLHQVYSGWFPR